jgi:hypothetical protein
MIAHYATWKTLKKKKSLQPLIKKLLSVALAWVIIMPSSRSSVAKSVQYTQVPWQLQHVSVKEIIHFEVFMLTNGMFLKIQYFPSQYLVVCK